MGDGSLALGVVLLVLGAGFSAASGVFDNVRLLLLSAGLAVVGLLVVLGGG